LEDNIRIYLREIRLEVVNWFHLDEVRGPRWDFVKTVMNFQVP
jgi:hypothetical protein